MTARKMINREVSELDIDGKHHGNMSIGIVIGFARSYLDELCCEVFDIYMQNQFLCDPKRLIKLY
jgi:hypothetical protein